MNFKFSESEEAFREELRTWLNTELANEPGENSNPDSDWEFNLVMRRKLADKGWLTMAWPEEYGGQSASHMMQVIFAEEMSYRNAPGRDVFGTKMMAPTLMIHGTEEQKQQFLPPVSRGDVQWCQGYSEPESGSDLASLQTRAVDDEVISIFNSSRL
jgi:alkylation response protein AidB-like acyl-CoA dehydrogenase